MAPLPAPVTDELLELILLLWLVIVIAVLVLVVKIRLVIGAVAKLHHGIIEDSILLEMLYWFFLREVSNRLEGYLMLLVRRPGDTDQTFEVGILAGRPVWAEA